MGAYEATKIGPGVWMVRWNKGATSSDDESNYVEAEIAVNTDDPKVAIEAAIARGSWA